ncbi:hypothetical protein CW705_04865 [Candidatus Bathyarchaeota archaeon]|nr:MAG: hypothetical protein CW705_04865 [Candidatus Bathyarchaeota archaeon]
MENEKIIERAMLLKRAFPKVKIYQIGMELEIPYFKRISSGWRIKNEDEACLVLGAALNDDLLMKILRKHKPREWAVFRGRFYVLQNGELSIEGFGEKIEEAIRRAKRRYGSDVELILKSLLKHGGSADLNRLKKDVKSANLEDALRDLANLDLIVLSYEGDKHKEWRILNETIPLIEAELGLKSRRSRRHLLKISKKIQPYEIRPARMVEEIEEKKPSDPLEEERERIRRMDREFDEYLEDLLKHRLEKTIKFGKQFSIAYLASYLQELFGSVLYFDSLLSITQQYGLANVNIIHEKGETGRKTGWSLALFGDPGTGKSFSTRDMILGKPEAKIGAHGLPGRNRYCGGMTPAFFIRIGQAYAGRVFNFIVPEFNDFFRYKGMVEPLKIAMEQGEIKYETHNEVIGPYRFTSFFSVNYNVSVQKRGYEVTIQDPNFNAIEDRMLCRLHRLTKERFLEITRSQMRLALGAIDTEKGAKKIRDHLTLVYAIETRHPLVRNRFKFKPVMITPQVFKIIGKTRAAILERIPEKVVKFSARLEDKALRFACAASLMDYFRYDEDFIPVSEEALKYAAQLYVEEASIRSKEAFDPSEVLNEIFKDAE